MPESNNRKPTKRMRKKGGRKKGRSTTKQPAFRRGNSDFAWHGEATSRERSLCQGLCARLDPIELFA
jgi:hypothetical protein